MEKPGSADPSDGEGANMVPEVVEKKMAPLAVAAPREYWRRVRLLYASSGVARLGVSH